MTWDGRIVLKQGSPTAFKILKSAVLAMIFTTGGL
jgi:hypothetical protein